MSDAAYALVTGVTLGLLAGMAIGVIIMQFASDKLDRKRERETNG